jgi:hypothetical protein
VALTAYTSWAKDLATGLFLWTSATDYRIGLLTSSYTFSAAHDFRNDWTNEVTGTNYTAGGGAVDNNTASAANPCVMSADDIAYAQSGSGFSTAQKYSIVKILGGASSADPLVAYGDAGASFGNVAGALTLDIPTSFLTVTVT